MAAERDGISRRGVVATAAGLALGLPGGRTEAQGIGPSKIMLIRHAEKPEPDGTAPYGLGQDGTHDVHALLVRGWERAGALSRFFVPRGGAAAPAGIATPTFLVAAAPTPDHPSRRAVLTLAPLAELAGLATDARFGPDREAEAASAILKRSGIGLVAWEHKRIVDLVAALTGGTVAGPHWSGRRYDMVLVLDRDGTGWRLSQVPQLLLAGDSAAPLPFRKGGGED